MDDFVDDLALDLPPVLEVSMSRLLRHFTLSPVVTQQIDPQTKAPVWVKQHKPGIPVAILTAYRSDSYDWEQNKLRNAELLADIRQQGYGYIYTMGVRNGPEGKLYNEPGFTVPQMPFELARTLAEKYQQLTFIWSDGHHRAVEYLTNTGQPTGNVPWTEFSVYTYPLDLNAFYPDETSIKKTDSEKPVRKPWKPERNYIRLPFALAPEVQEELERIQTVPFRDYIEPLREDGLPLEPEPVYGLVLTTHSAVCLGWGSPRHHIRLPYEAMCIVEFFIAGGFCARHNLPYVSVGVPIAERYLWLRNDGSVSSIRNMQSGFRQIGRLWHPPSCE